MGRQRQSFMTRLVFRWERTTDACGAVGCGNTCIGDPTGELCHFQDFQFVAQPRRGVSFIEFEGASAIFGQFALDNFTYLLINPIFLDNFEIGTTECGIPRWTRRPRLRLPPPPPSRRHHHHARTSRSVPLYWFGTDRSSDRHSPKRKLLPFAIHTRTELDWTKIHPNQYMNFMRFDQIAYITQETTRHLRPARHRHSI